MVKKIKPCPFCGGKATLAEKEEGYRVLCETDGCVNCAFEVTYTREQFAVAAWNKRPTMVERIISMVRGW